MTHTPSPRRFDRCDRLMLAILGLSLAALLYRMPAIWALVGFSNDDGTYLATAKSLADGRGYRHANLPGEPLQTKYPPVYPVLLAILWRCFPSFPQNLQYVLVLHAVSATAAAWLAYRLVRHRWGLSPWLACAGTTVVVTNPYWWFFVQIPMTEIPYALISLAALRLGWLAAECPPRAENAPVARGTAISLVAAVLAGSVAAAGSLTRSVGLALVPALVGFLLVRRRWMQAAVTVVAAAIPLALWSAWQAAARAENRANPTAAAFVYELDYSAWLPQDIAGWAWVAYINAGRLIAGVAARLAPFRDTTMTEWLQGTTTALALLWGVFALFGGLVVLGLAAVARRGETLSPLYVLAYWVLLCLWPGGPEFAARFQVPLLPLLAPALLYGVYLVAATSGDLWRRGSAAQSGPGPRAHRRGPLLAALIAGGALVASNLWVGRLQSHSLAEYPRAAYRGELIRYIREHLPENAVLAADSTGYLHLRTGRKVILPAPVPSFLAISYPADARFTDGGFVARAQTVANFRAHVTRSLPAYYQQTGATHVVLSELRGASAFVFEFVLAHPRDFKLVFSRGATAFGPYAIFEVGRPPR